MHRIKVIQTITTWVIVYPLITILIWLLDPLIGDWALPSRTLVVSIMMVSFMTYGPLPRLKVAILQVAHFIRTRAINYR